MGYKASRSPRAASILLKCIWNTVDNTRASDVTLLQSHEGESGTRAQSRLLTRHLRCFNPTTVHLERLRFRGYRRTRFCFNPTSVRLERGRNGRQSSNQSSLQSYKGASGTESGAAFDWFRVLQSCKGASRTISRALLTGSSLQQFNPNRVHLEPDWKQSSGPSAWLLQSN